MQSSPFTSQFRALHIINIILLQYNYFLSCLQTFYRVNLSSCSRDDGVFISDCLERNSGPTNILTLLLLGSWLSLEMYCSKQHTPAGETGTWAKKMPVVNSENNVKGLVKKKKRKMPLSLFGCIMVSVLMIKVGQSTQTKPFALYASNSCG